MKLMNKIKLFLIALVAMCGFSACEKECDHEVIEANVDYSESIIACWDISSDTRSELLEICADGTFNTLGSINKEPFVEEGTWTLNKNRLVLTTDEGKIHFSGTIAVYPEDVMLMTADGSKEPLVYYYWIELPFPTSLVGTWTCLDADFAEVLTIRENSMMTVTRLQGDSLIENMPAQFLDSNGGDGYGISFEDETFRWGNYEVVSGELLVLTDLEAKTRRLYHYCKEDLSEEILGMWMSTDNSSVEENNMFVQTFSENGKSTYTGFGSLDGEIVMNKESNYKVIGDACFQEIDGKYIAWKLSYSQNGTSLGDIMTFTNGDFTSTWLRVKQSLNLTGKTYAYSSAFVTNAKGTDEEFSMLGGTFNMANITNANFDVVFGADLYCVELNANSITHKFRPNGQDVEVVTPITLEGNKVTLDMSAVNPACRKVEMYMFQDADDCQLHMYMYTDAFINYFANLQIPSLIEEGKLDPSDAVAVEKVFADMEARVESINVSFVFKAIE